MLSVKQNKVEVVRSYNHIKHLVDTNEQVVDSFIRRQDVKHEANQLDGKQCHTGFYYYEYDMPEFGTPGWTQSSIDRSHGTFNFQEYLEDLEHDQARHQGIHGHGQRETCYSHRDLPGN